MIPTRTRASDSYNRLWTTCMARLPGIGRDALSVEIGNAMQEFTRETHAWREITSINLIAGQNRYNISPRSSNCAAITYVVSVAVDGRPYMPLSPDGQPPNAWSAYRVEDTGDEITLYPTPSADVAKGLVVTTGLAPKSTSLDLPDLLIARYFEHLVDGVLERAFAHHAKPYSDNIKALYHQRRFRAAITRTRRIVRGGDSQASPAWQFPTQAPGRPKRGARSYGW